MTELKGFGFTPDDEKKEEPLRGTNAHLKSVEDKKKREAEAQKPVDNSMLANQPTVPATPPVTVSLPLPPIQPRPANRPGRVNRTVPVNQPVPVTGRGVRAVNDDAGNVTVESNYMRFDMDIFKAIRDMTYGEQGIYMDLIRRAYGAFPKAKNMCSCTYTEIGKTSGVTSRDSISNAISSLEARGYIRRLITAYKKGDKSLYRVYLPCEIMGNDSRTKITISNKD